MDVKEMMEAASHPVFVCDERDRVLDLNPAAEALLGAIRADVVGRPFHETTEFRDVFGNRLCSTGCSLHEMVHRGEPIQAFDLDLRRRSGEFVRVRMSVVVVLGPGQDHYRMVYHVSQKRASEAVDDTANMPEAAKGNGHGGVRLRLEDGGARFRRNGSDEPRLTRREREILTLLVEGERSREISQSLGIRPNTLRSHTQNILRKLGARSKVEAVSLALRQNLL